MRTQPTGLGSSVGNEHSEVRRDYRRLDARLLAATLRDQLVIQHLQINGFAGTPPTITWKEDTTANAARTGTLLRDLSNAGLEPDDDALYTISEEVGFSVRRSTRPAGPFQGMSAAGEVGAGVFFRRERHRGRID